jgi:hypothetical protein
VELRRNALRPGARETLIELFDRELVEPQEAAGMRVLGQFRDLDDDDSFVWLRGFRDMPTRKRALESFYGGRVWKQHARAANATMLEVDNVLLLRPIRGLRLHGAIRAARHSTAGRGGLLAVTIHPLTESSDAFSDLFARELEPTLGGLGISVLATYVTEPSENTFPALPVRTDTDVFVWMAMFRDEAEHASRMTELERSTAWREHTSRTPAWKRPGAPETLRLTPTARSLIHA